jgi:hypothetical protein
MHCWGFFCTGISTSSSSRNEHQVVEREYSYPHPSKSKNGWMTTPECDCNVKVAFKIADITCGGKPIMFNNVKDIKMIQSVSGPMQCLELKCAAVMEELHRKQEEKRVRKEE